jgi:biopolymer transport protein ExbD
MSEINVTPLVDVMLVLLVIFIITAPLMASRLALNLPLVEPKAVAAELANSVTVSIGLDAAGQTFWGNEAVDSATLSQRLREAAQRDPATEVQLRADTAAPYGRVVQLIAQAQAAGLSRIGFVADPAELVLPAPGATAASPSGPQAVPPAAPPAAPLAAPPAGPATAAPAPAPALAR